MRINKINISYFSLGVVVLMFTHWVWFKFGALTGGDWGYGHIEWVLNYLNPIYIWKSDDFLGYQQIIYNYNLVFFFQALLVKLGLGYELSMRVLIFWPALFLPYIGIYKSYDELFQSKKFAMIAGLYASLAPRILMSEAGHLHQMVVYGLSTVSFYFLVRGLKVFSIRYILASGLFLASAYFFEPRVGFVCTIPIIFYIIFNLILGENKKSFFFSVVSGLIIALLVVTINFYWVFPLVSGGGESYNDIVALTPWVSRDRIVHGLLNTHPDWTWATPTVFKDNLPHFYLIFIPFFAYLGVLLKKDRKGLYFALTAIFGIFLLKQENSPIGGVYTWFFYNMPFFNSFRESSKFYYIVAFAFSFLFALGGQSVSDKLIRRKGIFIVFMLGFLLFIAKPAIFNEIGNAFSGTQYKSNYDLFKTDILEDDAFYGRQFWIPDKSRFAFFDQSYPITSYMNGLSLRKYLLADSSDSFSKSPYFYDFLQLGGYRYVVFPTDTVIFEDVDNIDEYIQEFSKSKSAENYTKTIYGDLTVFKKKILTPEFYLSQNVISYHGSFTGINSLSKIIENPTDYVLNFDSSAPFNRLGGSFQKIVVSVPNSSISHDQYSNVINSVDPFSTTYLYIPEDGNYKIYFNDSIKDRFQLISVNKGKVLQEAQSVESTINAFHYYDIYNLTTGNYQIAFDDVYENQLTYTVPLTGVKVQDEKSFYFTPEEQSLKVFNSSFSKDQKFYFTIPFQKSEQLVRKFIVEFDATGGFLDSEAELQVETLENNKWDNKGVWGLALDEKQNVFRYEFSINDNNNLEGFRLVFVLSNKNNNRNSFSYINIKNLRVKDVSIPEIIAVKGFQDPLQVNNNIIYQKLNPTHYRVTFDNLNLDTILNFNSQFNDDWIVVEPLDNVQDSLLQYSYDGFNVVELKPLNKYVNYKNYTQLKFRHFKSWDMFNSWIIPEGTKQIDIIFIGQQNIVYGWWVSGFVFVGVMLLILFLKLKKL